MSDQNEIDDILNELKNKKMGGASAPGNDKKSDDFFYSFTSPKKEDKPVTEESQIFNIGFDAPKKEQEAKHLDNNFDIISDSFKKSNPENDMQDKIRTDMPDGKKPKKNQNKKNYYLFKNSQKFSTHNQNLSQSRKKIYCLVPSFADCKGNK